MHTFARLLTVTAATAALTMPAASAFAAEPASPATFGQHEASCAQAGELGGTDNPGMHRGASGWDGESC